MVEFKKLQQIFPNYFLIFLQRKEVKHRIHFCSCIQIISKNVYEIIQIHVMTVSHGVLAMIYLRLFFFKSIITQP